MRRLVLPFLPAFIFLCVPWSAAAAARPAADEAQPSCARWTECRDLALDAEARGDHEAFHDLAWAALRAGPSGDPGLMALLARAQSLSGRPRDALVTIRRLAQRGVRIDADTSEDFRRVRALPDWPAVETLLTALEAPEPVSIPSPRPASAEPAAADARVEPAPAPASTPPGPPAMAPAVHAEAARFVGKRFVPGGLAYDAVSRRLLVGNLHERKVAIVGDGSSRLVDLVRARSAGFYDVLSLEIDPQRGDLWVVTAGEPETATGADEAAAASTALHKLQLISGRPLAVLPLPPHHHPARFSDVAIGRGGMPVVLDSEGRRLFGLHQGAQALHLLMALDLPDAASLAPAGGTGAVYVAHEGGLAHADPSTRVVTRVSAAPGVDLEGLERIRWHRGSLVGVQARADGSRRLVRLRLDRSGRRAVALDVLDGNLSAGPGESFATVSGDDLYYLAAPDGDGDTVERAVLRIRLR